MDETHNQINIVLFNGSHLCEMLNKLLFFFSISNDEQIRDFDQHYQGHVHELIKTGKSAQLTVGLERMKVLISDYQRLCSDEGLDFDALEKAINKE